MIPVQPNQYTTLALDGAYTSWGRFFTARQVIKKMMIGHVKGWDADGYIVSWDGRNLDNPTAPASPINWEDKTVALYADNPCLRSAPNSLTGLQTEWPIPTIVICTRWFGKKVKAGESISLRRLYKIEKGVCAYCGNHIPFSEATKDHIYPRSLGGSNDDFNLALACRKCNADKADTFPFYNKDGKIPEGAKARLFHVPDGLVIRPEWRTHLHLPEEVSV